MNTAHERNLSKEEWLTPPDLLQKLGTFDLDPCASDKQPWKTAKKHYTKKDDGLKKPWKGRVWCNPPYGKETVQWIEKLKKHGNGIALIFNRSDTGNFHDHIWDGADGVFFVKGRLYFRDPEGKRARYNAGAPSVLVAYGHENAEVLQHLDFPGKYVPLKNHNGHKALSGLEGIKSPGFYRARMALIHEYIQKLPTERGEKNSPRELLKQGYIDPQLYAPGNEFDLPEADSETSLITKYYGKGTFSEQDLSFTELTSYNTWFAMYPEKVAGQEEVTTSIHFPLTIKGDRQDVEDVLKAGLRAHANIPFKKDWQMTLAEMIIHNMFVKAPSTKIDLMTFPGGKIPEDFKWPKLKNLIFNHYTGIKLALEKGRPVPKEVLKNYPDLQTKAPKEEKTEENKMIPSEMIDKINQKQFSFVSLSFANLRDIPIWYKVVVFNTNKKEVEAILHDYMETHFPDMQFSSDNMNQKGSTPYWNIIGIYPKNYVRQAATALTERAVLPDFKPSKALPQVNYWYKVRAQTGERFEEVRDNPTAKFHTGDEVDYINKGGQWIVKRVYPDTKKGELVFRYMIHNPKTGKQAIVEERALHLVKARQEEKELLEEKPLPKFKESDLVTTNEYSHPGKYKILQVIWNEKPGRNKSEHEYKLERLDDPEHGIVTRRERFLRPYQAIKDADQAQKIKIAKAKAQAIKLKLQLLKLDDHTMKGIKRTNHANFALSGLSGLGFINTLGALPKDTHRLLDDRSLGKILAKEQGKQKKAKGKLSFEEVMKQYNEGITEDEIRAWVWYKRSLGIPMTAWKKFFLDEGKGDIEKVCYTKRATKILNNAWKEINMVPENTLLGKPTKFTHEYNGDTYLMLTGTDGNKYIVLERDVEVKESGQRVSEEKLIPLVKKGVLFYANGELLPYPIFAYGNMYDREDQLKVEKETIIAKYGQEAYDKHLQVIRSQRPAQLSIQTPDENERQKIAVYSDFAVNFHITDLAEDLNVEMPRKTSEEGIEGYSLQDAFEYFLQTLDREDFGVLTGREIWRYYVKNGSTRSLSDAYKATIEQYAPIEGEALFARFLHEGLSSQDKQRLDYEWNRIFNGYSNIPYHRIPVGFECSNSFLQSDKLEFSPAQREAIAFMQAANSGIIAYDVGVGKTMSAIITVANALYEGKTKRPVIVVPNATYDKWKRELFGFTDEKTKEFYPGVLSYTDIKLNDWFNLGSKIKKKVNLDKAVPENSITMLTYEGFTQIGYSRKVMEELFDELAEILTQKPKEGKRTSQRDYQGKAERFRKMIGMGNKKTIADIDTLGFDFMCVDEAHNMKNVFVENPLDSQGEKRYTFQEKTPSERGIKAFFLCNFIQRRFGRNVMLLTATPFTNSPMEIYSMLSLVALDTLKKMGIKNLQTFMETFIVQDLEYVARLDDELALQAVIKRFNNRLILQKVIHNSITYKTGEDAGVKRPCKINLPRLYTKNQRGETVRLQRKEHVLTYLQMSEEQENIQARIVNMAKPPTSANPFKLMGWSLANAISPFLVKGYPEKPKDYMDFINSSPKIQYTVECIKSVKEWHEERKEPVSGQVIYMNRGKDYFPFIKQYLEEKVGFKMGVKHQGKNGVARRFDEVELIISGMSADRKEAIKDAFLDNVVKVIIGTSTITEGIDLQKYGTVLYILQPDWNPTSIKQVEGRIHRQQNTFGYVRIVMPLVQNSMDVFVFQKLEEKTARINDIWYRADRGNVLDQESLDPEEVKFALFTNVFELAKVERDKASKEVGRKKEVAVSNIQLLHELKVVIGQYYDYQKKLRDLISSTVESQQNYWANPEHYMHERWFQTLTEANRKKAIEKAGEVIKEASMFKDSGMSDDKELIRIAKAFSKLLQDSTQYNENYQFTRLISEFRNYLSQVRKAEKTTLAQKGYTIDDDFSDVIAEYMQEKEMYEREKARVESEEYFKILIDEVQAKKDKLAINGANPQERAEEFAKLNYLLQFSAGEVEEYGHCMLPNKVMPDRDGYVPSPEDEKEREQAIADKILQQEAEQEDHAGRKRKILVAKAKAQAIKIKLKLMDLEVAA